MSELPILNREDIVRHSLEISGSYERQGLKLTIRQLYYQFVARALIASGQKSYKRIVATLTKARLGGEFPLDRIEDRGRDVVVGDFTRCDDDVGLAEGWAAERVREMPDDLLDFDRWYGQPTHVSVWVEKEALSGVFERPCRQLGVSMFACKGYPSVSSLNEWLENASTACTGSSDIEQTNYSNIGFTFRQKHRGMARRCMVLYFGDHDPDGFEIPRSALRNLRKLMRTKGEELPIKFERIALNMDQIRQYNPPPFEAKITSSRFAGYVDEHHTHDAWELDALDPAVLQKLIRDNVARFFDESILEENLRRRDVAREELKSRMIGKYNWLELALDDRIKPVAENDDDETEHELDFDFADRLADEDEDEDENEDE